MICNPDTCILAIERRDNLKKEILNYINKPCDGFIHKYSCGADCLNYHCIIFGGKTKHYCKGKKINIHAFKFIRIVGCYSYGGKNGNHTE